MTKLWQGASPRSSCGGEQQSSRSTSVQLTLNKAQVIEQGSHWKKNFPEGFQKGTRLMKQNPTKQMGCFETLKSNKERVQTINLLARYNLKSTTLHDL